MRVIPNNDVIIICLRISQSYWTCRVSHPWYGSTRTREGCLFGIVGSPDSKNVYKDSCNCGCEWCISSPRYFCNSLWDINYQSTSDSYKSTLADSFPILTSELKRFWHIVCPKAHTIIPNYMHLQASYSHYAKLLWTSQKSSSSSQEHSSFLPCNSSNSICSSSSISLL
mgnify:CR=1 FL=1